MSSEQQSIDPSSKRRTIAYTKDEETGQTKVIKAIKPSAKASTVTREEDGPTKITVPVSSTTEDRDGDEFTESGLEEMMEQLSSGEVPLFLDHGLSPETMWPDYRVLEIQGKWVAAELDENGVVMATAELREDKEEAEELVRMLEQDMPVGFSVGFIILDHGEKDDGGLLFQSVDMLETSAVGIPSNPDGVAQAASAAAVAVKEMGATMERSPSPEAVEEGVKALLKASEYEGRSEDSRMHSQGPKAGKNTEDDTMPEEDQEQQSGEPEEGASETEDNKDENKQDAEELLEQLVENQESMKEKLDDLMGMLEDDGDDDDEEEEGNTEEPDEDEEDDDDDEEEEQQSHEEDEEGKSSGQTIETLEEDEEKNNDSTNTETAELPDPNEYGDEKNIRRY